MDAKHPLQPPEREAYAPPSEVRAPRVDAIPTAEDTELARQRKVNREEIGLIYGLPYGLRRDFMTPDELRAAHGLPAQTEPPARMARRDGGPQRFERARAILNRDDRR